MVGDAFEALDRTGELWQRVYHERYGRELLSIRSLLAAAFWFLLPAVPAWILFIRSLGAGSAFALVFPLVFGLAFFLVQGIGHVRAGARKRAARQADQAVREALPGALAAERAAIEHWAAGQGLAPVQTVSGDLPGSPLYRCSEEDVSAAVGGHVGGAGVLLRIVTQLGSWGTEEGVSFRRLTVLSIDCADMGQLSVMPRTVASCALNQVSGGTIGNAWRTSHIENSDLPDGSQIMAGLEQLTGGRPLPAETRAAIQKLVTMPHDAEHAAEARALMQQQMGTVRELIRERLGGDDGHVGVRDVMHALGSPWHPLQLESVEFNDRYELSYCGGDDEKLRAVKLLSPAVIVELIDLKPDDYAMQVGGGKLTLARLTAARDPGELDQLLTRAQRMTDRVSDAART